MGNFKLPLPYISHSQFYLFERDPMAYYEQYFIARVDNATPKMIFGKIFQEAWSDKKYNYKEELRKAGFTSDKERIIRTALSHPETFKLPKNKTEKKFSIRHPKIKDYDLLSILDGMEKDKHVITENKMGVWWTEKMVQESTQITWYMMCYYIKYGKKPKVRLQSFNSNNGRPRIFPAKRTQKDFDNLIDRINAMIIRIEAGDFTKYEMQSMW